MIFVWFMAASLLFLAGHITNTAMNDTTKNSPGRRIPGLKG